MVGVLSFPCDLCRVKKCTGQHKSPHAAGPAEAPPLACVKELSTYTYIDTSQGNVLKKIFKS